MPVLTVSGGTSYPHGRGRGPETEDSLKRVAVDVRSEVVPDCGHFVPEEAPEFLNSRLLDFFGKDDKPKSESLEGRSPKYGSKALFN